jgi:hypothetical protein
MSKKILLMLVCFIFLTTFFSTLYGQSSQTAKPIREFKEVAGKWEGKMEGPGWATPMTIIINDDGSGYSLVPNDSPVFGFSENGRFPMERKLDNGKIRSKNLIAGSMSTVTLYEDGGKRFLKIQTDDGTQNGIFEPAPK